MTAGKLLSEETNVEPLLLWLLSTAQMSYYVPKYNKSDYWHHVSGPTADFSLTVINYFRVTEIRRWASVRSSRCSTLLCPVRYFAEWQLPGLCWINSPTRYSSFCCVIFFFTILNNLNIYSVCYSHELRDCFYFVWVQLSAPQWFCGLCSLFSYCPFPSFGNRFLCSMIISVRCRPMYNNIITLLPAHYVLCTRW